MEIKHYFDIVALPVLRILSNQQCHLIYILLGYADFAPPFAPKILKVESKNSEYFLFFGAVEEIFF